MHEGRVKLKMFHAEKIILYYLFTLIYLKYGPHWDQIWAMSGLKLGTDCVLNENNQPFF